MKKIHKYKFTSYKFGDILIDKIMQRAASVAIYFSGARNTWLNTWGDSANRNKKPYSNIRDINSVPDTLGSIDMFLEKNGIKPPESMRSKGKVVALQSNSAPAASSGNGKKSLKTKFCRTGQTVFRALFRPARWMKIFKEVRSWFR